MQFGVFELTRKLATGGMAEIFLARQRTHVGLQRNVVVKRILPELANDASFVESFLNEGRLVAQLNHPNIVQIYDLGVIDGAYFMAMEYIRGFDVSTILRVMRRTQLTMPLPVVLRIMCDVFNGLHYAHTATDVDGKALGIVHRDVTPSNIIVTLEGGQAKVVDFGIAKATASDERRTRTGTLKGKLSYLAPEQAQSFPFDHRVDLFAASIVFYELLSGNNPFRGESEYATMRNIVDKEVPRVDVERVDCPTAIADLLVEGLAKDPAQRLASAAAFTLRIERVAAEAQVALSHSAVQAWLREHESKLQAVADKELGGGEIITASNVAIVANASQTVMVPPPAPPKPNRKMHLAIGVGSIALAATGLMLGLASRPAPPMAAPTPSLATALPAPAPSTHLILEPKVLLQAEAEPVAPAPKPPPKKEAPIKATGTLRVAVTPWAEVEVDGKRLGITPMAPQKVAVGSHKVKLSNPEFGQPVTKTIAITANKETVVKHDF